MNTVIRLTETSEIHNHVKLHEQWFSRYMLFSYQKIRKYLTRSKVKCHNNVITFKAHLNTYLNHVMQRTVLPRPFCPSVCQSRALWQNESNLCPHSYIARKIIHPRFLTRRMVGGGHPFYLTPL